MTALETAEREQLIAENMRLQKIILTLLRRVGQPAVCHGPNCQRNIVWILHQNGERAPYDLTGESHWVTCPDREQFRRKRV